MIYGSLSHEKTYSFLPREVQEAIAFARTHDLSALPKGRNDIAGDALYVNIAHYTTGPSEEKGWEAHRDYLDIHVLAEGCERIDLAPIERMQTGTYEKDRDYVPATGEATASVTMHPGDFLLCFPEDVHRPGVMLDAPAPLKKGIFKVRVRG